MADKIGRADAGPYLDIHTRASPFAQMCWRNELEFPAWDEMNQAFINTFEPLTKPSGEPGEEQNYGA